MNTKKMVYSAVVLALSVAIPALFHLTGIPGNILLPMHLPVLIGGLLLGPVYGLIVGLIAPILNFLLTNMPQVPILYIMIFELGAYGFFSGFLYKKTKKLFISLLLALLLGRIVAAFTVFILVQTMSGFAQNPMLWFKGSFIKSFPGIIVQLLLIPLVVSRIELSMKSDLH
ncbi:MAG: ECF transporter S component [Lagierella massiliensis]|nr:ECF transporter S component [Lagierella massiliensis]